MHPAYSVILFTVSSGLGYGLFIALALAVLTSSVLISPLVAVVVGILALGLITVGLFSSMMHLGHPERAWRAVSQWRSSWLSREGLFAILFYGPALLFLYGCWQGAFAAGWVQITAAISVVLAVITLWCTGMIYASLRTIAAWHQPFTTPNYILLGIVSGLVLFAALIALSGAVPEQLLQQALIGVLVIGLAKIIWWRRLDRSDHGFSRGEALGLGKNVQVREMEPAHSQPNFVMREMGYQVARRHRFRLRQMTLALLMAVPAFAVFAVLSGAPVALLWLAVMAMGIGLMMERWLFFAEAVHIVTLYYPGDQGK